MPFITSIFLLFILSTTHLAVAKVTDDQGWFTLTGQGPLAKSENFHGYLEIQPRYSRERTDTYETLARPAIYFKSEGHGSYFLGYLARFNGDEKEIEKRYWLQHLMIFDSSQYRLTTRIRAERRDLNLSSMSDRVRLMVRFQSMETLFSGTQPFIYSEIFYNLNSVGSSIEAGLQQSRTGFGLGKKFENQVTIEAAYMKNIINGSGSSQDSDNNILQIGAGFSWQ